MNIALKKAVSKMVVLEKSITNLETCKFQVFHSLPAPFNLRFTFFNDLEEGKSIYLVLDVKNGELFELYTIAADLNKTFNRFELYADVTVALTLDIRSDFPSTILLNNTVPSANQPGMASNHP